MPDPKSAADGSRPTGGTITFVCPNGHKISVPAKLAGKRGACSKCGTAVVIPAASVAVSTPVSAPAGRGPAGPDDVLAAGGDTQPGDEGTITLKAPPAWPAAPSPPVAVAPPLSPSTQAQTPPQIAGPAGPAAGNAAAGDRSPLEGSGGAAGLEIGKGTVVANPMALLVARLWAERDHGGIVELHLVGGSVILPEWYEPTWSQGSHGLFASQAADGSVTLTAVAWDSIQKVVVRQVEGLPDGMFE